MSMFIEHSLRPTLGQLQDALSRLSAQEYACPLQVLGNSSIGQHTRHIIEFFQTLINGYDAGIINYDKRERNLLLETDPQIALNVLAAVMDALARVDKAVQLTGCYSPESGNVFTVKSTYYRELVYNLEHAVHHMAMIKIGIRQSTNVQVPSDFGVAAATIHHQKSVL